MAAFAASEDDKKSDLREGELERALVLGQGKEVKSDFKRGIRGLPLTRLQSCVPTLRILQKLYARFRDRLGEEAGGCGVQIRDRIREGKSGARFLTRQEKIFHYRCGNGRSGC